MSLSGFLKFVEIQTKVASVIPFILGTLYSLYRYETFNFQNFITMFISLITFDMATTAINNYCDYRKANVDYEVENPIISHGIGNTTAVFIIFALVIIAVAFGIKLTLNTNIVVLLIGLISFAAGILYTFGPIPISRMPLGEVFSGIFMGLIITFLAIYIHIYDENILTLAYQNSILKININIFEVFYIFLVSIPAIGGIANIMLANNICDVETDIINKRFTLPYYIGRKSALNLFKFLYYIGYVDIAVLVILGILPITSLLVLATLLPVNKNIKLFCENPSKSKTFVLAVKNFVIINVANALLIGIMVAIKYL
ncbi:1,4-dihydroxy-2-naphthoate polyprenyltransferase [Clostridium peptidivorans]|uniref:1,4-dihydroxy-2-naphthoate polyprenyltransferase n=1 Tax=Clostridium peptidivorans TaxID=100174 RepID=UPI000BE3F907|nr:1,4-dihydroxy-2-naphthoate polyprenyltransferase [Clostridium peptidivorans]